MMNYRWRKGLRMNDLRDCRREEMEGKEKYKNGINLWIWRKLRIMENVERI